MPGAHLSSEILTGYDLVLTPTVRAARQLEGLTAETKNSPVDIMPWRGWTASLWQRFILAGLEQRVLLNDAQAGSVWEQVLQRATPATLRPVRSIVDLCAGAYRLACEYGALPLLLNGTGEPDSDAGAFTAWLHEFERRSRQEQWIAPASLDMHAAQVLRSGRLPDYRGVRCLLYGFDPMRPAKRALVEALEMAGATVISSAVLLPPSTGNEEHEGIPPVLLDCKDTDSELTALTRSLQDLLRSGARRIAVVFPNISEVRTRFERGLHAAFSSERRGTHEERRPVWEFSEGVPLTSVALARDAIQLLRWLQQPQMPQAIFQLLRSPYLDFGIGMEEAGALDAYVLRDRERIRPEWSLSSVARKTAASAPAMAATLLALDRSAPNANERRHYSEWADMVRHTLKLAGWPGSREKTSYEFQAADRWDDLMDQVTSLDSVAPPATYEEFFSKLEHLGTSILFSPQNMGAPIQIMPPSEAEGSSSEVLWLASADEEHWNSRQSPHPLLPFSLQKELSMPGTDPGLDYAEALNRTKRLACSAQQVIFSYASANESGPVRPSALTAHVSGIVEQFSTTSEPAPVEVQLEPVLDTAPLPSLPDTTVSGGISILQHQAACAFRAFAERRLFSSELDAVDLGMGPRERGSALHKALQLFWQGVHSQAALHRHIQNGTLETELRRVVEEALPVGANAENWTREYLAIQRERLVQLLRSWMAYEAERPPFEVLHTEHEVQGVEVGPLRMNMRVDRIDRVDDGGQSATVLIDYKTGTLDVKGWLGERPAEPQLPLYATCAGFENVQAVAFATVKPGRKNLGLKSFPAKSKLLYRGSKETDDLAFEQQMVTWRETLENLAADFMNGRADVGPREYPATCQWCAQRMLCRLNPELLEELADEEEDSEAAF